MTSVLCHHRPWGEAEGHTVALTVVLYYLLLLAAVVAYAGCTSVSEKFMKPLSFGQICNYFITHDTKELEDPGAVRHVWLGVRSS